MITIITGTPGAGKTAAALWFAVEAAKKENRPLYIAGVRNLQLEKLPVEAHILERGDMWFECPNESIILLDEGQEWFRQRKTGSEVPIAVQKMERHRHHGIDIILTTQAPTLVDVNVRKLCGRHIHLQALPTGGSATWYEYLEMQSSPTRRDTKEKATVVKAWRRPREVFEWYQSTEAVTGAHKRKIPGGIWLRIVVIVGCLGFAFYNIATGKFLNFSGDTGEVSQVEESRSMGERMFQPGGNPDMPRVLTAAEWSKQWQARIPDLPWSAPAYDEALEVRDFPRPQCVVIHGELPDGADPWDHVESCVCLSQQATALNVSEASCIGYVKAGWFDPSRERPEDDNRRGARSGERFSAPSARSDPSSPPFSRVNSAVQFGKSDVH